jgi:hypothetical protein
MGRRDRGLPIDAAEPARMRPGYEKMTGDQRLRMEPADLEYLDRMALEGHYKNRAELIRSILREIIRDDKAAHA